MSYLARSRQPSPEATGSVNLRVVPMPPTYRFEQPEDTRGKWCFGKGEPQVLGPRVDVPRYEWGYFGAHYNCDRSSHVSYYGDYFRWRLKKY